MKNYMYPLLLCIIAHCSIAGEPASSPFKIDKTFRESEEGRLDTTACRYIGRATISGQYRFDMRGELVFIPTKKSARLLPEAEAEIKQYGLVEIFIGEKEAVQKLALKGAIKKIDGEQYCAFEGFAQIEIVDLYSNLHADHKEFSARLVRVLTMTKPKYENCSGVENR